MVKIIGAGLSGLAAAIVCAKAGKQVHLYEKYDVSGKRFQGDLQGLENWSHQQDVLEQFQSFGINTDFDFTAFNKVLFTDGKKFFEKKFKRPLFYLVKRGNFKDSLDQALVQQALEHNVKIHYKSQIDPKEADIIASGPIRKACVASDRGVVFQTNLPNIAVGFFHDKLAYLGYSYLLIANGYGCLCTVVFQDFHKLNSCFEETVALAKKLYPLDLSKARPVGGLGSFCLNYPRVSERSRYVGEAAGFQDLLWGFGIRLAISSGFHASQSFLKETDYEETIKNEIEPYLKASVVNRYLWEKLKIGERPLLPYLLSTPFFYEKAFLALYKYTFLHRLIFPIAKKYIKKRYHNSIDYPRDGD